MIITNHIEAGQILFQELRSVYITVLQAMTVANGACFNTKRLKIFCTHPLFTAADVLIKVKKGDQQDGFPG